jgi:hypothetical protein
MVKRDRVLTEKVNIGPEVETVSASILFMILGLTRFSIVRALPAGRQVVENYS